MSEDVVSVQITANIAGLTSGLDVASKDVKKAAQDMGASLGGVGSSAKTAGGHVNGFTTLLKDFKAEQTANARTSRFFANELTSIIPGADGAAGAVRGLVGVLLEGSAIGAGFELAKVGFELLAHHIEEAEKKAQALKTAYRDTATSIEKAMEKVNDALAGPLTATAEAWRTEVRAARDEVKKAEDVAADYLSKSHGFRDFWSSWFRGSEQAGGSMISSSSEIADEMTAAARSKLDAVEGKRPKRDSTQSKEDVKRAADVGVQVQQIEAATAGEVARIEADLAAKLRDLEINKQKLGADGARLRIAYEAEAAEQIRRIREDSELKTREMELSLAGATLNKKALLEQKLQIDLDKLAEERNRTEDVQELAQLDKRKAMTVAYYKRQIELAVRAHEITVEKAIILTQQQYDKMLLERVEFEKKSQAIKDAVRLGKTFGGAAEGAAESFSRESQEIEEVHKVAKETGLSAETTQARVTQIQQKYSKQRIELWKSEHAEAISAAETIGTAFGDVFGNMISGAQSFQKSMADMAKSVLRLMLDLAIKSIMASALKAGGEAASSQAGIPIVGPALAVGAMTAMIGTVMGLLSSLPSAAGGAVIPRHSNPIFHLHGGEHVIPEEIAERYERGAPGSGGGGGGGGGIVFGAGAIVLGTREFFEHPEVRRAMAEARRNGRL